MKAYENQPKRGELSGQEKALLDIMTRLNRIESLLSLMVKSKPLGQKQGPKDQPQKPYSTARMSQFELLAEVDSAATQEDKLAVIRQWNRLQDAKKRRGKCKQVSR